MPDEPDENWDELRKQISADLRRVADRLRSMSAARLAGQPAPPEPGGDPYQSRAQAARAVAAALADAAAALEAAATGRGSPDVPSSLPVPPPRHDVPPLPELSDFAAADQLQVTGNDLLAAMDLFTPDAAVPDPPGPELRDRVTQAAALLADLRRRL